ncbi:MAG: hypothetical protein WA005_00065 [Candidatus Binataceae bacterium]
MNNQFDFTDFTSGLREKLRDQIRTANEADDLDKIQRLTALRKRLEFAATEVGSIAGELNGQSSKLGSKPPLGSAFVTISEGDLKQHLFRLREAKRQGMNLPENAQVTLDLVAPNGIRTIQTMTMDYKFKARSEFGEFYTQLQLRPNDRLLLEEIGSNRFRITKP